jgi:beta-mannosidase
MFAIKVNGERLWIRGANWIPDDPFPTRVTRERYQQRISDMLEVNINGIRVWGGGLYESDDFYDLCDQEGIVVWQDFLFACAAYPETPQMFEEIAAEVDENVRRLSSHASLVIWCGGNECIEGYQYWGWKEQLEDTPWGENFYRRTIPGILADLDQSRPYIPGSPISTHSEDVKSFNSGTNHIWDVWNELGYERYEQYSPSFAAEFGFNGPGSWSMLTRAIGKTDLDSKTLEVAYHQRAFDGMTKIANGLSREFANPPTSGAAWYFAAALDQARAVEIGLKHFRSLYETCSGSILWQFNDMWPAISWAVIDYTGFRKLAWHAMKAAYRPRTICVGRVDQGAQVTILNDTNAKWDCHVDVKLISDLGEVVNNHTIKTTIPAFGVSRSAMVDFFPEIKSGTYEGFIIATSNECTAGRRSTLLPAAKAPIQDCEIVSELSGGMLKVTVTAKQYLHELSLLTEIVGLGTQVDAQMAYLLPGERHTFIVNGPEETLVKINQRLPEILWSHNRVING